MITQDKIKICKVCKRIKLDKRNKIGVCEKCVKGKYAPNYQTGKYCKKYYCKLCKKLIHPDGKSGLCNSCCRKGRKLSNKTKKLISKRITKLCKSKTFRKRFIHVLTDHHIYGKKSKEIITIPTRIHRTIHTEAYWYLVNKLGKKEVKRYLK